MSVTVLSMCAPVSNRKPPPAEAGSWRHVPAVRSAQSCQTRALTLSSAPTSPLSIIRAAARTCGERLPGKATTSSRPVRSRVAISASASAAFMTMGFSRRTSTPASRQAVVWAAWKTCGVMMKATSSWDEYRSRKRVESGSLGGVGSPTRLNSVAASSTASGDGSENATTVVSARGSISLRWVRAIAPTPMMPTRTRSVATSGVYPARGGGERPCRRR